MSALAKICLKKGYKITGSDSHESDEIIELIRCGVSVYIGHDAKYITDPDLVVYTGAIPSTNCERQRAEELHIPTMERAEFLGKLVSEYATRIAVAGTHGKTTTTSMLGWVFDKAGYHPTIHIGGESVNFDSNMVLGDDEYIITEACEYRNSMRYLSPTTAIITSIEEDHMDCYQSIDELQQAFYSFAGTAQCVVSTLPIPTKKEQYLLYCSMNKDNTCEYALHNYIVTDISEDKNGCVFEVIKDNKYYGHFKLSMHGKYNISNALIAIAVADYHGIEYSTIYNALRSFKGVKRRYEKLGEIEGKIVVADYAHHPTEIDCVIRSLQQFYPKLLCVFQPHTYSRTEALMSEFVKVLPKATYLCMLPTYPAREEYSKSGDSATLYKKIKKQNKCFVEDFKDIPTSWLDACDAILLVGAGDIYDKGKDWLENLPEKIKK